MASESFLAFVGVFLKLSIGSAYYFITKMITQTCTFAMDYEPGVVRIPTSKSHCKDGMTQFKKTFFLSTVVFASMCLAMVYFVLFRRKTANPSTYSRQMILLMFMPSMLECIAFCMGVYAQILMALSLAMIMKGAKVVFSGLFTVTFLKRKLQVFHWVSVALCLAGLAVAGASEYLNNPDDALTVVIGCCVLLAAECMKAFHVIYDEMMMKKHKCDVLFVVGMEGIYSTIFLIPALLITWLAIPGSQNGSMEDLPDSLYRIEHSTMLTVLFSILPVIVVILAIAGVMVIKYLTGVHNALISVARSAVIWALELIFFYCAPEDLAVTYGKAWGPFSPIRLVGFVMVVVATLMYDEDIKIPCLFSYPSKDQTHDSASIQQKELKGGSSHDEDISPKPEVIVRGNLILVDDTRQ